MTERSGNSKDKNALYRSIPKVDALLLDERIEELGARYGHAFVMSVIREKTDELRELIRRSGSEEDMESASDRIGREGAIGREVAVGGLVAVRDEEEIFG